MEARRGSGALRPARDQASTRRAARLFRVCVGVALGGCLVAARGRDDHDHLAADEPGACALAGEHAGDVPAGAAVERVGLSVGRERVEPVVAGPPRRMSAPRPPKRTSSPTPPSTTSLPVPPPSSSEP